MSGENREKTEKTELEDPGRSNHGDSLPQGWVEVRHHGMPIYLHKQTGVCTNAKPYYLGPANARFDTGVVADAQLIEEAVASADADAEQAKQNLKDHPLHPEISRVLDHIDELRHIAEANRAAIRNINRRNEQQQQQRDEQVRSMAAMVALWSPIDDKPFEF